MSISYFGAMAWILVIVFLGQKLGKAWNHIFMHLHHPLWIIIATCIVGLGLLGIKTIVRQRRFSSKTEHLQSTEQED